MTLEIYYKLKSLPNIYRILRSGHVEKGHFESYYSPIEETEIQFLLHLIDSDGVIECSEGIECEQGIVILKGPLKGLERTVKKVDRRKRRAKIEIDFMEKVQLIEVGLEVVPEIKYI